MSEFDLIAQRVDLFHGIQPTDIEKIFRRGMTYRVSKGEALFYKGTAGNHMYVILGGTMGVFDGESQIATLGLGATFGEMSLLLGDARSATVKALEDSVVFKLDEHIFQKLLTKKVAVQMLLNISRSMARRIQDTNLKLRESQGR